MASRNCSCVSRVDKLSFVRSKVSSFGYLRGDVVGRSENVRSVFRRLFSSDRLLRHCVLRFVQKSSDFP